MNRKLHKFKMNRRVEKVLKTKQNKTKQNKTEEAHVFKAIVKVLKETGMKNSDGLASKNNHKALLLFFLFSFSVLVLPS